MSNWKLSEKDQSTFIYELGEDGINKWNCDVQPGFSGGKRASSEYLHSVALKMRAADELYEALEESNRIMAEAIGQLVEMGRDGLILADSLNRQYPKNSKALAKARGEM